MILTMIVTSKIYNIAVAIVIVVVVAVGNIANDMLRTMIIKTFWNCC